MTVVTITRPAVIRRGILERHQIGAPLIEGTEAIDLPLPLPITPTAVARYSGSHLQLVDEESTGVDQWAARFAQAVVEVVAGDRSVTQLLRACTPNVYADLSRRASVLHRAVPAQQRLRRVRAMVRSVHVYCPRRTVAEISIHVRQGERGQAIAARLEFRERRWQCVAIEFA